MTSVLAIGVVDQDTVVFAFVLAAFGLILITAGWFGLLPSVSTGDNERSKTLSMAGVRLLCGAGALIFMYSISGWPVLALFGGAGGWYAPVLKGAKKQRRQSIERVDAIATWVETIRDNISGSAGLSQALRNSGANAPEPIRVEVRDLVLRLQHEPLVPSLRRFAADLAHPTADMAIGCLILASTRSAGSLTEILANTSQAARDSASMMRHVESGRVQSQSQGKMVGTVAGGMSLMMIMSNGDFVEPYNSAGGQVTLFIICSLAAGSVVAMQRLARVADPIRVFRGVEVEPAASRTTALEVHQ